MKNYFISVLFVLGSFVFGEFYPFTQFPMYSEFPNYAYVFYVSDRQANFIPLRNFGTYGGAFSHLYFSVANELKIKNGYGFESKADLEKIGKRMHHYLNVKAKRQIKSIEIHRIHFFHYENKRAKVDRVIYATP